MLTYRQRQQPTELRSTSAELTRRHVIDEIILDPLGADAIAEMAEAMTGSGLTSAQRERLAVLSDGNPFHVEELVRSTGGALGALDLTVPRPVGHSVLSRLDSLEPVARQAVCRAAIIGREVPVDQLAGLMGWEHAETVRYATALVEVGLLEDVDGGRRLRAAGSCPSTRR